MWNSNDLTFQWNARIFLPKDQIWTFFLESSGSKTYIILGWVGTGIRGVQNPEKYGSTWCLYSVRQYLLYCGTRTRFPCIRQRVMSSFCRSFILYMYVKRYLLFTCVASHLFSRYTSQFPDRRLPTNGTGSRIRCHWRQRILMEWDLENSVWTEIALRNNWNPLIDDRQEKDNVRVSTCQHDVSRISDTWSWCCMISHHICSQRLLLHVPKWL